MQLSGIPNIGALTDLIKGTRGTHAALITSILDIAALGTARQVHKASFAWCMLRAATAGRNYLTWAATIHETNDGNGGLIFSPGAVLTDREVRRLVGETDYSGKKMWLLYGEVAKKTFQMACVPGADMEVYRQWLSYSTIGLWTEDTAILETIFDVKPILRCDYGDAFKERRTKGIDQDVKMYTPVWVAKLASAAQTHLGAVDPYVACRAPCISGKAVSDWADDDVRNIYIEPVGGPSRIAAAGPMRLKDALDDHKRKIERVLTRYKKITYGTTSW